MLVPSICAYWHISARKPGGRENEGVKDNAAFPLGRVGEGSENARGQLTEAEGLPTKADWIPTPGAKTATVDPQLEKLAILSPLSVAPTAHAPGALAGRYPCVLA